MISESDQTVLLLVSGVIVLGTLIVLIWQWWRSRGRDDD